MKSGHPDSPFKTTHSSRFAFVSGQEQQIRFPENLIEIRISRKSENHEAKEIGKKTKKHAESNGLTFLTVYRLCQT
jgi:hypothetical protein